MWMNVNTLGHVNTRALTHQDRTCAAAPQAGRCMDRLIVETSMNAV